MSDGSRRAAWFLLLAPGPLAEVLSGNVPLFTFAHPLPFLLVTLTYGVPVLAIREFAVNRNLNVIGIALLGLAYGILNEGVIAKTLPQPDGAPLHDFAGYGRIGPLQGGWALFILPWHALHSVLYPILIASWLAPRADRPWFTGRARPVYYVLVATVVALCGLYFNDATPADPAMFVAYVAAALALVAVALRYCRRGEGRYAPIAWPGLCAALLLGMASLAFYVAQFAAPGHVPFVAYACACVAVIALAVVRMKRAGWRHVPQLLLFGLGDYLAFALFSAVVAIATGREALEAALAAGLFVIAFTGLARAVVREPLGRGERVEALR
jgi:hypothetical protein